MNLLFELIFGHFLADVALQPLYLEERKKNSWFYLMTHALIYGGVVYYIAGCDLTIGLLAFGTHWFIDKLKIAGLINLLLDQTFHIGVLLLIWGLLC